jgi:hypothetical protein
LIIDDTVDEKKFWMGSIQFWQNCSIGVNRVYSVLTSEWGLFIFIELFEIGVNRKVLFFYGHISEGSFVGARVVEKSRLQGFLVRPMENPIDYRFNGLFLAHHEMSRKWFQSKEG